MFVEQSSVSVQGRITYGCLGIWNDAQTEGHAKLAALIHQFNAKAAIQIAHSGRKGSSSVHGKAAGRSGRPISTPAEKDRGRSPLPAAFRSTTAGRLPTC